jgi:sugar lactone lactonase YvrE
MACGLSVLTSGCSLNMNGVPSPESGQAIQGKVFGGEQPIVGAQVYLLAAATSGYGNLSNSLLTAGTGQTLDSSGGATNGFYYATTGAGGGFSIGGDYTCTGGQQVYLYALGGDSGSGFNSSSGLMAALGTCPGVTGTPNNAFSSSLYVVMNEISTVATAYAIAGFATDAVHVSSGTSALAQTGMANAFANVPNLETLATGAALATNPAGNATVPQAEINTLANILASCINTTGQVLGPPSPTPCYTLFTSAMSGGNTGAQPSDTATAAINIAHNPGNAIAALYGLSTATPPFAPPLTTQPNDFTVALAYTGGGLNAPEKVAIDALGDAWVTNYSNSTVTEFSPAGAFLSGTSGYSGGGITNPVGIAIDGSGNAFVANSNDGSANSLTKLNSVGSPTGNSPYAPGGSNMIEPYGVAIDASGNAWVAAYSSGAVKVSSGLTSFSGPYSNGGLSAPYSIALDHTGNVWVANLGTDVAELNSSGASLAGSGGYRGGGIVRPTDVAIDSGGNAWVADVDCGCVVEITSTGTYPGGTSGFTGGGIYYPQAIALDGSGNVWVADSNTAGGVGSISELNSAGTGLSPSTGYVPGPLYSPTGVAVDGSGNVWMANNSSPTVTEIIGVATPVVTPLVTGVTNNTLATRP